MIMTSAAFARLAHIEVPKPQPDLAPAESNDPPQHPTQHICAEIDSDLDEVATCNPANASALQAEVAPPTNYTGKCCTELQSIRHLHFPQADVLQAKRSRPSKKVEAGRDEHKSSLANFKPMGVKAVSMNG